MSPTPPATPAPPTMLMRRSGRLVVLALAGLLVLAGCAGDDDDAAVDAAADETAREDSADDAGGEDTAAQDGTAAGDGEEEDPLCRVLADIDLEAAFSDTLTFDEPSGRDQFCTVRIDGAEGEGLIVQVGNAELYEAKLSQSEQVDMAVSQPDLGQEAVLVGNGDLTVLVDSTTSLSVGLSAFFTDGEIPPDDVLQQGVVDVAQGVLDGM